MVRYLILLVTFLALGASPARAGDAGVGKERGVSENEVSENSGTAPPRAASIGKPAADQPPRIRSIATLRLSALVSYPDTYTVSASMTALKPFVLEVGVARMTLGGAGYARVGASIPFYNHRNQAGVGWAVDALAMAGYRYTQTGAVTVLIGGGHVGVDAQVLYLHGVTANTGLEAIYWSHRHLGIDLQLALGGIYWVSARSEPVSGSTSSDSSSSVSVRPLLPEVRAGVGLAF